MSDIKHSETTVAPSLADMSLIIGLLDNGDGTFTNFNYTPAQIVAYTQAKSRKSITVDEQQLSDDGKTLTDPFFHDPILEITAYSQNYIAGEGFTQDTENGTITGVDFSFYPNQKIIAKS